MPFAVLLACRGISGQLGGHSGPGPQCRPQAGARLKVRLPRTSSRSDIRLRCLVQCCMPVFTRMAGTTLADPRRPSGQQLLACAGRLGSFPPCSITQVAMVWQPNADDINTQSYCAYRQVRAWQAAQRARHAQRQPRTAGHTRVAPSWTLAAVPDPPRCPRLNDRQLWALISAAIPHHCRRRGATARPPSRPGTSRTPRPPR